MTQLLLFFVSIRIFFYLNEKFSSYFYFSVLITTSLPHGLAAKVEEVHEGAEVMEGGGEVGFIGEVADESSVNNKVTVEGLANGIVINGELDVVASDDEVGNLEKIPEGTMVDDEVGVLAVSDTVGNVEEVVVGAADIDEDRKPMIGETKL